jgi:putative flippase GtrA
LKNNLHSEFLRYAIVGGMAFCIDIAVLFILTEYYHVYYLLSNIFAFSMGLLTNYILSIIWVFHNRQLKNTKQEFIFFAIIGLLGLGIGQFLLWSFTVCGLYYLYSKIIATVVVFLWNFIVRKKFLFTIQMEEGNIK